ncbi:hypothetical protein HCN44_007753 [Aphidius gifuensis]|uniref:Uncharacterized protein n=1 Tax=Aphidius gifuensis TaxID=684658 RepID=A0A834XLJ9_APHGI|nr:hypothetical protein HCN44_007753 [Aphidius gifuensis]
MFSVALKDNMFNIKQKSSSDDFKTAVPLINLLRVSFTNNNDNDEVIVGGRVLSMDWDPSASYVAILFPDC